MDPAPFPRFCHFEAAVSDFRFVRHDSGWLSLIYQALVTLRRLFMEIYKAVRLASLALSQGLDPFLQRC